MTPTLCGFGIKKALAYVPTRDPTCRKRRRTLVDQNFHDVVSASFRKSEPPEHPRTSIIEQWMLYTVELSGYTCPRHLVGASFPRSVSSRHRRLSTWSSGLILKSSWRTFSSGKTATLPAITVPILRYSWVRLPGLRFVTGCCYGIIGLSLVDPVNRLIDGVNIRYPNETRDQVVSGQILLMSPKPSKMCLKRRACSKVSCHDTIRSFLVGQRHVSGENTQPPLLARRAIWTFTPGGV